jgi:hypothetical protein
VCLFLRTCCGFTCVLRNRFILLNSSVRLLNSAGLPVENLFVDFPEGLWDTNANTLTVLMHPGRIKHGLKSSQQLGLALQAHSYYTLQIAPHVFTQGMATETWRSIHRFNIGHAVNTAINPNAWTISVPLAFTNEPLKVGFDRALDRLSIETSFLVQSEHGQTIECSLTVGHNEKLVTLTPNKPWLPGNYQLLIHPEIEDAAGNRIGDAFEAYRASEQGNKNSFAAYQLFFTIRP